METKTHYRRVFKSDHLGISDLEDFIEEKVTLIFTIKEVKQHVIDPSVKGSGVSVAGKVISANIAHFVEPIKPLVLNSTNSKVVKSLAGGSPFVEDWKNICVELFIDSSVKMKGEVVGGVRLKAGSKSLPKLTKDMPQAYLNALNHIKAGNDFKKIEERFFISEEIKNQLTLDSKK
jgi:hypothetical protein